MIFLIQYNREQGRRVQFEQFDDSERQIAYDTKLKLELKLNSEGIQDEVVILEAADESVIRRSHRRYFETLEQLLTVPA